MQMVAQKSNSSPATAQAEEARSACTNAAVSCAKNDVWYYLDGELYRTD